MRLDDKERELLDSDLRIKCELDNDNLVNMTSYHDMHPDDLQDYEYSGEFDNDIGYAEMLVANDAYPVYESKEMERLHSAMRVAGEDYDGIELADITKKMARKSATDADGEYLPIRHDEHGITMQEFKDIIFNDKSVLEAVGKNGEDTPDNYFNKILKNVGSVNILKNDFDAFDEVDSAKAVTVMLNERNNIASEIEKQLSKTYQTYRNSINAIADETNSSYKPEFLDRLPATPRYLDVVIGDDNKEMLRYMDSVMPALKGVSAKSLIPDIKEEDVLRFTEMANGNQSKGTALALADSNERLKFQASTHRPAPERGMKHLLPDTNPFDVEAMINNNTLASKFTKTTANISMYTFSDGSGQHVNRLSNLFDSDEKTQRWEGIKPAGSMNLITGIDGQSNPSYSEPKADSFAVMSLNKQLSDAKKILVGASPDMRDTAGFAYMTESNGKPAYDAILYVPPQNFDGVASAITRNNKDVTIDVLGDLIPHKAAALKTEVDGQDFEEAPATGLDFAKHVEMNAIKENLNMKVLLPVGGMQTWDELRQAVTTMSENQGLGHEQAKSYFNQTVNNSMVDSNIRTNALKSALDNQDVKPKAIAQEVLAPDEPVVANDHTIEQPRQSNRSRF